MTLAEVGVLLGVILGILQLIGICIFLGRVYEQVKTVIFNLQEIKDGAEKRFLKIEAEIDKNQDIVFQHMTNTGIHQERV